ncbi:MAG: hypothetical protein MUO53_05985 [Maribacter sp.]|nr:hypothetical protein [Maribacter sp.]
MSKIKNKRYIVKAKDEMIGISIFFSDVRMPNEQRENRPEEKKWRTQFRNKRTNRNTGVIFDL